MLKLSLCFLMLFAVFAAMAQPGGAAAGTWQIGQKEKLGISIKWSSSEPRVLNFQLHGLAMALNKGETVDNMLLGRSKSDNPKLSREGNALTRLLEKIDGVAKFSMNGETVAVTMANDLSTPEKRDQFTKTFFGLVKQATERDPDLIKNMESGV